MVKSIGLGVITAGRSESLRRLFKSVEPVNFDQIVLVETRDYGGENERLAKELGIDYFEYHDPEQKEFDEFCLKKDLGRPDHFSDFAAPRNFCFSKLKTDYIFWLDSDDVLHGSEKLRQIISDLDPARYDGLSLYYLYAKDEKGNVTTEQWRERCLKRDIGEWFPFLHELYLGKKDDYGTRRKFRIADVSKEDISVEHCETGEKHENRDLRNLRLLLYRLSKDGNLESRMWKYLGKAYRGLREYPEAIEAFRKHIDTSNWDLDQFFSFLEIAQCCRFQGATHQALVNDLWALEIAPQYPQGWAGLAIDELSRKRFDKALVFAETGIARLEFLGMDTSSMEYNPTGVRQLLYWSHYKSLYELGRHQESVRPLLKLREMFPEDKGYEAALKITQGALHEAEIGRAMAIILSEAKAEKSDEKLDSLRKGVPKSILDLVPYHHLKRKIPPRGKPSLALICPGRNPRFGPSSLEQGCGGSEKAAIHMASALAGEGFYVDVFHDSLEEGEFGEGEFKHRWYPYAAIRRTDIYDHVIGWRNPDIFKDRFHARTQTLWLHDVATRDQWPDSSLEIVDKVIVLSKFHRSIIPFIPESKIIYSRNGIHPSEFSEPNNDPKKVIYASNPTRGLKNLLLIWPEVHKRTGAELSLFYGFTDWHRHLVSCSPHEQKFMLQIHEMLEHCKDFGIKDYGMIPPKELSKHMAGSGVWAYPTQFKEISCMVGIEVQCMGAIPVVTDYAALRETVQFGEKVAWEEGQEYPLDEYKEKLIAMILDPGRQESIRGGMVKWARENFLWKDVASQLYRALELGDCRPLRTISSKKDSEKILVA